MAEQGFTLISPDFHPDGEIPSELTCDGDSTSPELKWIHPPKATRSFALIVDDPDAPDGTFTHWVLYNIPADVQRLPAGTSDIGLGGRNDLQHYRYAGPCPPPNHGKHRYVFKLFALDTESLHLEAGAPRTVVEEAMQGHILDQVNLVGHYERTTG